MTTKTIRNTWPSLAGLAAFGACILACTSFSPDDKKILYPTIDVRSGAPAISVYDRPSGTSKQVFVAGARLSGKDGPVVVPMAQWLADGKHCVVACDIPASSKGKEAYLKSFTLIPLTPGEAIRSFTLPEQTMNSGPSLLSPPVIGTTVYTVWSSNLVSIDMATFQNSVQKLNDERVIFAVPMTNRLGYTAKVSDEKIRIGLMDPATMTDDWSLEAELSSQGIAAFSPVGRRVAVADGDKITLLEPEGSPREIRITKPADETLKLGYYAFSGKANIIFASYETEHPRACIGIIEVPLDGGPQRRIVLLNEPKLESSMDSAGLFQFGLSHDGKTLAVSSAGIAFANPELDEKDCALFLVDLASADRKVTKVPIPLPASEVRRSLY